MLLPLGPLAVAAIRGYLPYFSATSSEEAVEQTAANLGRMDAMLWLSVVAMIALVPSALGAARLAQRRAPVLSLLAVGLLVPSFTMLFFGSGDTTLRVLAGSGLDTATAARLYDASAAIGPMTLSLVVLRGRAHRRHGAARRGAVAGPGGAGVGGARGHRVAAAALRGLRGRPVQPLDVVAWG